MNVCLYVWNLCKSTFLNRSEPNFALGLEEVVGYVWTRNSWPLRPFGPSLFRGHCRILGTRWLPVRPFPVIPLYQWIPKRVIVTSYGRCPARPPSSSAAAFRPLLLHVFVWRHAHDVLARDNWAHSYCAFLALCVMHRKRGEDNNTHACKRGNLMTLGGLIMIWYFIRNCTHNDNTNVYPI
jgi:hypothetical protein